MRSRRIRGRNPQSLTIVMTGGLNQSISNLELQPGELFDVVNYEEIDGTHFGYRSTDGYERWDMEHLASSVPLEIDYTSTPPIVDDSARETERGLVTKIPGVGDTLGLTRHKGEDVYAFKDDSGLLTMVKATATGWSVVPSFSALTLTPPTEVIHTTAAAFAGFDGSTEQLIICTGNNQPVRLSGSTGTASLLEDPLSAGYPLLPATDYPTMSVMFNERCFLAYPNGDLYFSGVKNPGDFDPATVFGGVYSLGDEITNLITAPNTLVCICKNSIHMISKTDLNLVTGVDMAKEVYNDQEGGYTGTAQKIMGRVVYASRDGITSLDTTANFGDFEQVAISKKVQKTFDRLKGTIIGSSVVRDKSQYRLYFSNGTIIAVTFNIEKQVKGATLLSYPNVMHQILEIEDNVAYMISTDDDYMYRRSEDAMSFDGANIVSALKTAYYHYKSPTTQKVFTRALTEVDATAGTRITVRPIFDYAEAQSAVQQTEDITRIGGTWSGGNVWGLEGDSVIDAVWGVGGAVQRLYTYIQGIGTNMSIAYASSAKHYKPHTIHNTIVNFNRIVERY